MFFFSHKARFSLWSLCLFWLCLFLPCALWAQAPSDPCSAEFDFDVVVTPSTCQANGTITVNLKGQYQNFQNFHYSVIGTGGSKNILPQISNVLTELPAGTHRVYVSANCITDNNRIQFAEKTVTVGGNYTLLQVTSSDKIRNSHAACAMGRLAFLQSGGKGENFTYRIVNAPASANLTLPYTFTPTKEGESYIVPGQFPPGDYTIAVADECYETQRVLTIADMPLPEPAVKTEQALWAVSSEVFFADKPNPKNYSWTYDVLAPMVDLSLSVNNPFKTELDTKIEAGEYEVGWALPGDAVPTGNWRTYDTYVTLPVPQQLPDDVTNLELHVRRKDCPTANAVWPYRIDNNFYFDTEELSIMGHDCNTWKKAIEYSPHTVMRYPLKVYYFSDSEFRNEYFFNYAPPENWSKTQLINTYAPVDTFYVPYDISHVLVIYSADKVHRYGWRHTKVQDLRVSHSEKYCTGRIIHYQLRDYTGCLPLTLSVTKNGTEDEVYREVINDINFRPSPLLLYNTSYTFRLLEADNSVRYTGHLDNFENRPLVVNWLPQNYEKNLKQSGIFVVDFEHLPRRSSAFEGPPNGAKWELIDPNGKVRHEGVFDEVRLGLEGYNLTTGKDFRRFPDKKEEKYLPGEYKLRITEGECVKEYPYTFAGFYDVKNFTYTTETTCRGFEVIPQGQATYGGANVDTYFRVISGPPGTYSTQHISAGERFVFSQNGTYAIGIRSNADVNDTHDLDTLIVYVKLSQVRLDAQVSIAYSCNDNVDATGHIYVRGVSGIPPYSYELWNEANTTRIKAAPDQIDAKGIAYWNYGHVRERYTVRIIDACGNNFPQLMEISDLSNLSIASTPDKLICVGEEIQLRCLPLRRYEWYNPQGELFSTEQNPRIFNAKRSHSGRYKVKAFPEGCGMGLNGFVDINVEPCWAPVNPNLMHRVEANR